MKFLPKVVLNIFLAVMFIVGCKSSVNKSSELESVTFPAWVKTVEWQPDRPIGAKMEYPESGSIYVKDIVFALDSNWPTSMKNYLRKNSKKFNLIYYIRRHEAQIFLTSSHASFSISVNDDKTFDIRFAGNEPVKNLMIEISSWKSLSAFQQGKLRDLIANLPDEPIAAIETIQNRKLPIDLFETFLTSVGAD